MAEQKQRRIFSCVTEKEGGNGKGRNALELTALEEYR
jgi:hypothetical protein